MKKHKENLFSTKFRLLNSQENSEVIVWSSSDSSEFEDVETKTNFINITNKKPNRKRKRKSNFTKNVSNLDITIIDVNKDSQGDTSPVLTCKTKPKMVETTDKTYCISKSPDYYGSKLNSTSPVLCPSVIRANLCVKSPVIPQKFASPIHSPKVKKALFNENICDNQFNTDYRHLASPVSGQYELDRRKSQDMDTMNSEFQENEEPHINRMPSKNKIDLIKKVKSFFDSHFNSESSSQVSIADTPTPKNTSSDDVEILSITQLTSNESSMKTKHTNSTDNSTIEAEKSKKIRYKKNGLAYRLSSLLKKHCANISLWQHERFLADNSNFKIPKGEHLVFRIQKVNFKYGSYLLEAMDGDDEMFLILINVSYVNNCIFNVDSILKLYEPFQIINLEGNKLVVNVCKFECVTIDV